VHTVSWLDGRGAYDFEGDGKAIRGWLVTADVQGQGPSAGKALEFATKLGEGGGAKCLKGLVDLIGIEPMTSSMPWWLQNAKLLTDKQL
jgi:hypothetical protein